MALSDEQAPGQAPGIRAASPGQPGPHLVRLLRGRPRAGSRGVSRRARPLQGHLAALRQGHQRQPGRLVDVRVLGGRARHLAGSMCRFAVQSVLPGPSGTSRPWRGPRPPRPPHHPARSPGPGGRARRRPATTRTPGLLRGAPSTAGARGWQRLARSKAGSCGRSEGQGSAGAHPGRPQHHPYRSSRPLGRRETAGLKVDSRVRSASLGAPPRDRKSQKLVFACQAETREGRPMAQIMRMPPESELPDGPHRDFAGELRCYCRAAGCPPLRQVSPPALRSGRRPCTLPGLPLHDDGPAGLAARWPVARAALHRVRGLRPRPGRGGAGAGARGRARGPGGGAPAGRPAAAGSADAAPESNPSTRRQPA